MENLLYSVYFFALFSRPQSLDCSRKMLIEHVGSTDKAIYPIVLSTQPIHVTLTNTRGETIIMITNEEFTMFREAVQEFNASSGKQKLTYRLGTFTIAAEDSCEKGVEYTYTTKTSKRFMTYMLEKAKQLNPEAKVRLQFALNVNLERIRLDTTRHREGMLP